MRSVKPITSKELRGLRLLDPIYVRGNDSLNDKITNLKMKIFRWILKLIGAILISTALLSLFTLAYEYSGTHIDNSTGSTDYRWESNQYKSNMTEGFSFAKADINGFNNLTGIDSENINILMMGSSHMEGFNVPQDKNTSYILDSKLQNMSVYNIGISGHTIYRCANNIEAAVNEYKPSSYVVIETSTIQLDTNSINEVLNGNLKKIESYDTGVIYQLQKIPCFKLIYKQFEAMFIPEKTVSGIKTIDVYDSEYITALDKFLKKIESSVESNSSKIIIFYQPSLQLNRDGVAYTTTDENHLSAFQDACDKNNIIFVDMTDTFISNYKEKHIMPHGFTNTAVGTGHLNENGHEMIANKLDEVITSSKNEKNK